jgi:hypothetical protein
MKRSISDFEIDNPGVFVFAFCSKVSLSAPELCISIIAPIDIEQIRVMPSNKGMGLTMGGAITF